MNMKLLIANRGEIALRIIRTCRRLHIRTVLVYSDPDRNSLPLHYADSRYALEGASPRETYLNAPKLIEAALKTGCDAIHPGYGFLSEDAAFVAACEEKHLMFVGPSSKAMEKLGNKLLARATMRDANVPVIPGTDDPVASEEEAVDIAWKIGFPVILKAVYGGGGRGMRIAQNTGEVRRFFRVTTLESQASFGRGSIYIEKCLINPRHIEIQAIADSRGKVVTLGERECTIQRRHQKLLEETPSVAVSDDLREKLVLAAKKGLQLSGYTNAGTVEFLLDRSGDFYFLETNKRLQVEHLVTELVTRIDLVEEQLKIASGDGLDISQNEIRATGWAINCRINAEDPRQGFVPSPGTVIRYHAPAGPGIRMDSALYSGCSIPEEYDSMIAKLASWGRNRSEAIERMKVALDEIEVSGVPTTIPLHRILMNDRQFNMGDFHTDYLHQILPRVNAYVENLEKFAVIAAVTSRITRPSSASTQSPATHGARWREHARFLNMTQARVS